MPALMRPSPSENCMNRPSGECRARFQVMTWKSSWIRRLSSSSSAPMARLDGHWGDWSLQGIVGWFVPDRFDLYGRRWAVIQPGAPLAVRSVVHLLSTVVDESRQESVGGVLSQSALPSTPYLRLSPEFAQASAATDWSTAGIGTIAPVLGLLDQGTAPYVSEYVRRHHVGADAVTIVGPIALRGELAYDSRRVFSRTDLTGFTAPVLVAGAGAEYQTADLDRIAHVEASYVHAMDPTPALIGYERDTVALFASFLWPLGDGFKVGTRAMLGLKPSSWLVQPELTFEKQSLELTLGVAWLDGTPYSVGGYYAMASGEILCGI